MNRPLLLPVCLLFMVAAASAQNQEILYDFTPVPQALMLNPGIRTGVAWHAGIPGLSGISIMAGSSGFSVHDLFADDGLDFTTKVRERLVYGMGIRDQISSNYRVELLQAGFRAKKRPKDYYSFGIYHEGDLILYWPRDLAILGFEGNAGQLGRRFNLAHLKTRGEYLNVFHFGINRQISSKLNLGARAKIYSGILDFNSTGNSGYFVTTPGSDNVLAHTLVADMRLRTSGMEAILDVYEEDNDNGGSLGRVLTKRGFFGGDLGVGLDLGMSYALNKQTYFTASVLDLGFLYHSTDVRSYSLEGEATVEGVSIILPDALADPDTDFWQQLVDDVEALIPFREDARNYLTFRPTQLYSSIRYNFGETYQTPEACECEVLPGEAPLAGYQYKNSVGGQLHVINRPRGPQWALTGFYQRHFGNTLALKGTYTVDKFSLANVGLGFSVQAGPVHFFLLADNLLALRNIPDSQYASLQLGLNILSWGRNR